MSTITFNDLPLDIRNMIFTSRHSSMKKDKYKKVFVNDVLVDLQVLHYLKIFISMLSHCRRQEDWDEYSLDIKKSLHNFKNIDEDSNRTKRIAIRHLIEMKFDDKKSINNYYDIIAY